MSKELQCSCNCGPPGLLPKFVEKPETPEFSELKKLKLKETSLKWSIITSLFVIGLSFCAFSKPLIKKMLVENTAIDALTLDYILNFMGITFTIFYIISLMISGNESQLVKTGKHSFFDHDESEYPKSIVKLNKKIKTLNRIYYFMCFILIVVVLAEVYIIYKSFTQSESTNTPSTNSSSITKVPIS